MGIKLLLLLALSSDGWTFLFGASSSGVSPVMVGAMEYSKSYRHNAGDFLLSIVRSWGSFVFFGLSDFFLGLCLGLELELELSLLCDVVEEEDAIRICNDAPLFVLGGHDN